MRWNKALNYLLAIFIGVNSVLALVNYQRFIAVYSLSEDQIQTIVSILKDKRIEVEAKLPTLFVPRSSIWIEPIEISSSVRDQIVNHLFGEERAGMTITNESNGMGYGKNALVYSKEEAQLKFYKDRMYYTNGAAESKESDLGCRQALKLAKAFVKQLNLTDHFEEVKIDYRSESYGMSVTYYEVYKGLPIFDSYVKMKISPSGVFEAEVRCLEVTDKVGLVKPLYPIDQVLFALEESPVSNETYVIESVELGYRLDYSEGMHILSEEAMPMYKITIKGLSEPIFVNAYTNTYEEILFISQV